MSPADLGKVVWMRVQDGRWLGPCLAVDVSGRHDFYANVIVRHEIIEVGARLRSQMGDFPFSTMGEAWLGACPTVLSWRGGAAQPYAPELEWTAAGERRPLFWPYPKQEWPLPVGECWADRRQEGRSR